MMPRMSSSVMMRTSSPSILISVPEYELKITSSPFLTVNGTHTTLAFLTLAAMEPPPHRGLPKNSYELAKAIVDDRDDDDPLMDDDFEDDGIDPEEMRVSSASGRGSFCGS